MFIELWVAFALAVSIVLGLPGPANLAVSSYACGGRPLAAASAVFGTAIGATVVLVAALAGLIALLRLSPDTFSSVQWISGVYLIVLLIRLLRGPVVRGPLADNDNLPGGNPVQILARSAATVAFDPKTALLGTALFAQLVDALRPDLGEIGTFASMFLAVSLATLGVYAAFATRILEIVRAAIVRAPARKTNGKTRIEGGKVAFGYRRMAA